MIFEKVLKKGADLNLPKEIIEKAHLLGRIKIVVEENEIIITKTSEEVVTIEEMVGLGKGIFNKDSVTLQREIRGEWKL
jgi:hypothetical protein